MFFLSVWKLTVFGITRISGKLKKGEKKIIFTLDRWFTGNLRCNLSFNLSSFCFPGSPLFVVISFGSIFFSLNIQVYVTQAFPLLRTFPQPILVVSAISLQESLTFGNPYIYHIETGIVYWLFRNWQKKKLPERHRSSSTERASDNSCSPFFAFYYGMALHMKHQDTTTW